MSDHIKIYGVKPRIQYTANGTLATYEFPFVIFSASNIDVYLNDEKQESSAYTVLLGNDSDGGSVTFNSAPASGTLVTIVRNLSIERTTDFQEGSILRANVLNDELDYQIACQQQIAENLNRSMVLPPYAVDNNLNLTLPTPSAGKAIVWNASGTNLENSTISVNALESTIKGYKTAAENAAATATTKAGIASDKADIATAKAQIASDKADEAAATLDEKANADMDNLSSTGKENIIALGQPDYNSGVALSNLDTYQNFEKDGIVVYYAYGSGLVPLGVKLSLNGTTDLITYSQTTQYGCYQFIPLPKGVYVKRFDSYTTNMTFYPLKGEQPEGPTRIINYVEDQTPVVINNGVLTSGSINPTVFFSPQNYSSWEISGKIKIGNTVSDSMSLFSCATWTRLIYVAPYSNGCWQFLASNLNSWIDGLHTGTLSIQTNTTYWIKVGFTGTEYYLKYSTDGENYTKDISFNSTQKVGNYDSYQLVISPMGGENYLDDMSITADGNIIWTPYS